MLQRRIDARKNALFLYPLLTGSFHMRENSFLPQSMEKTSSLLLNAEVLLGVLDLFLSWVGAELEQGDVTCFTVY
jgi:hypothetical protein